MTQWTLSIEESKATMSKNIFVLVKDGRKLYVKTVLSKDKTMLELVPLSRAELIVEGIQVEETYSNTNIFSVDIEESASEEPKKRVFDMTNPKDVAEAEAIAKAQLEKLKKEDPEHYDLEEENEDLKAKLQIVAEQALEKKMSELGVPESLKSTFREDPSKLQGYELAKKGTPQTPSGTMPLNSAQIGSSGKEGFESEKEMIDDLYKRQKSSDPQVRAEAKAILNALWQKWYNAKESNPDLRDKTVSSEESPLSEIKRKCIDSKKAKESRGETA